MKGKEIKHGLKRFAPRPEAGFRTDVIDGVEFPYFLWRGKKHYFIHPVRTEWSITDENIALMFSDAKGNFAQAKAAYFVEAGVGKTETSTTETSRKTKGGAE